MYFSNLTQHGVLAAALLCMAFPAAHAGWEDAPSIDFTLESREPMSLVLIEYLSDGEKYFGDGLLGVVQKSKDASAAESFTQLRPLWPCDEKSGEDKRPTSVQLQPGEKVNIRMRNPKRLPNLETVLILCDRTNPKLVQLRLLLKGDSGLKVRQCGATSRWFPFKCSLGEQGLLVQQGVPVPKAAEGAREEAELDHWIAFREESKGKKWAW